MNATDLNNALKERMDGLSVKVFRTYNASITLDRLLYKDSVSETVEEKKADYDRANKEVTFSFIEPLSSVTIMQACPCAINHFPFSMRISPSSIYRIVSDIIQSS